MLRYPSGEQITVPRHIPTRRVPNPAHRFDLRPAPAASAALMQLLARPTGLALRTPLKRAVEAAISRLPEGPDPEERAATRYTIVCDVIRGEQRRRGVLRGGDTYGVTAALVTKGALDRRPGRDLRARARSRPRRRSSRAQFLEGFDRFGIEWEVGEAREPAPVARLDEQPERGQSAGAGAAAAGGQPRGGRRARRRALSGLR